MEYYNIHTLEELHKMFSSAAPGSPASEEELKKAAKKHWWLRPICGKCEHYYGGTFCKKVKHCVNKFTPAGNCGFYKEVRSL